MRRRGNSGPKGGAKPPYDGATAFRMGWPPVPPFQMKARCKARWMAAYKAAEKRENAEKRMVAQ
jgi:hypothetical protein